MNAILPEGLYFFHFLEVNLKIKINKWLSRLSGTSQQKVKSQNQLCVLGDSSAAGGESK
jgi:hypothetical protein